MHSDVKYGVLLWEVEYLHITLGRVAEWLISYLPGFWIVLCANCIA